MSTLARQSWALSTVITGGSLQVHLIEEAFEALSGSLPDNRRLALNWGDSSIGNIIYRDCRPVALLDWEMATAGPPEVDVAWMVFMHRFFQDAVSAFGMAGMPHFLRADRVVELYEWNTGERLEDLLFAPLLRRLVAAVAGGTI